MKLSILFFLSILILLTSCNGQTTTQQVKTENIVKGDTVTEPGSSIMVVYQDRKNVYWFGSWETGVYKYDGKELVNYTTKHGLPNNRIDEIKADDFGNLYFVSFYPKSTITKFDGNTFTTLYEMQLPKPPNLPNPFGIYSIYKDGKGNIWFGTNPVGVCRYDGKSFEWITEEDVTEFRNEGANGVRSITEDKNGDFWFNTEYRYSVYNSTTLNSNGFYTRHKSIGGLDGKNDSNLDEYLSSAIDDHNNLWFVTYLDGVWKYDGTKITHYAVKDNSQDITLFSIYKDNNGDLWLGTHENGAYKFNGQAFEKFKP
jgi:ligand-binding sensor domain-containing protein